jgi:diguanylate cyclase (GGDEF)-like protein
MPKEPINREIAFSGLHVRRKVIFALSLCSLLPLLLLTYAFNAPLREFLGPLAGLADLVSVPAILLFTGLLMAGGAFVVWDIATALSRAAQISSDQHPEVPAEPGRKDEIGTLMSSFARMLATIEQQAADVNEYARRLDTAYKDLESTSAQLKEFSFKDEVTGLYNRRFFSIRLEEEVSRYRRFNHPVSVVLLDLDGFKAVNDELGHGAGDETLRAMADILLKQSRGINVICRYGGDEFAVLLVETSKSGARLYADRIRYVLSTWTFSHGRRVTASFGIASLPEDVAPAADELIRAADEALYAAKRAGKNRVSVHEDIGAAPGVRPGA